MFVIFSITPWISVWADLQIFTNTITAQFTHDDLIKYSRMIVIKKKIENGAKNIISRNVSGLQC